METSLEPIHHSEKTSISVYILAAPDDSKQCEQIQKYLKPIILNSKIPISIYSDFSIPVSEDIGKYKLKLLESDIVLALISSDYINDDETYDRNQKVLERHNKNETILIPILIRNFLWKSTPFVKMTLLPRNFQPLNNRQYWNSEDDAITAVVEDIYNTIQDLTQKELEAPVVFVEPEVIDQNQFQPIIPDLRVENPDFLIPSPILPDDEKNQINEKRGADPLQKPIQKSIKKPIQEPIPKPQSKTRVKSQPNTPIDEDWRSKYYGRVLRKRFGAYLIDLCIFLIALITIFKAVSNNSGSDDTAFIILDLISFTMIFLYAFMESSNMRGTLGKYILGLQITDEGGHKISFGKSFIRQISRSFAFFLYITVVGSIWQYFQFKKTKKLFYDEWSGTVIGERLPI